MLYEHHARGVHMGVHKHPTRGLNKRGARIACRDPGEGGEREGKGGGEREREGKGEGGGEREREREREL